VSTKVAHTHTHVQINTWSVHNVTHPNSIIFHHHCHLYSWNYRLSHQFYCMCMLFLPEWRWRHRSSWDSWPGS